jgi:hypothetical protein
VVLYRSFILVLWVGFCASSMVFLLPWLCWVISSQVHDTSSATLFLRIAVTICDWLWFPMNFKTDFYISLKKEIGILMGISSDITSGCTTIFTVSILTVHEHGWSFHFLLYYSCSFFDVLQFSLQNSFPYLIILFLRLLWMGLPSYFFSACLLLVQIIEKSQVILCWICILQCCHNCKI